MNSTGFVHNIDPILFSIGGMHAWWYGFSFVLGFLNIFFFLKRNQACLMYTTQMIYDLTLCLAFGVLIGGRLVEVVFYEWGFYRNHIGLIPACWVGGMATHGLLIGGISGAIVFCRRYNLSLLPVTDALAIPAAVILGFGRIGNFIDGQIVGSLTGVAWAVKFPDAEGFRHPVVLYDGLKNFLLVPILLSLRRKQLPQGALTGVFLCLYAGLRVPIDIFREYPTSLLGLATGQALNILMTLGGILLAAWCIRKPVGDRLFIEKEAAKALTEQHLGFRRFAFVAILIFSVLIPSDWTADVPSRYGKRHPGLTYSMLHPRITPIPNLRPAVEPPRLSSTDSNRVQNP